jgi:hypothetical protein
MSPITIALTFAGSIFGGALLGMALGRALGTDALSADSKDAIKLGAGTVSLMSALVLGLLVSSAKSNFDATNDALTQGAAKLIMIDRVLQRYGPEATPIRDELRRAVERGLELIWGDVEGESRIKVLERSAPMERVLDALRGLAPKTETQSALRAHAVQLCNELLLSRWLQIEQAQTPMPRAFLAILFFWLTMLYTSFGLLAPRNGTVIAVLLVGALSLGTAIFLILEMNDPMGGAIRASSGPLRNALEHLRPQAPDAALTAPGS